MGLVIYIANGFKPKNDYELDEFIQLGRIGLWKAIKKYDPSRNTEFSTIAWYYIKGEILRQITKENKRKEFCTDKFYDAESNEQERVWEYMPDSLSDQEKQIFQMKLEGYSFIEIGKTLGYSRAWATNVFKRIASKIKDKN